MMMLDRTTKGSDQILTKLPNPRIWAGLHSPSLTSFLPPARIFLRHWVLALRHHSLSVIQQGPLAH